MTAAERAFRPNAVDQTTISTSRPALHAFVRALAAHERFTAFAAALPARARVSEPALPLLLATLHDQLARPLVCVLPEDADARDAADAAGWFLGAEQVALLPSRGVHRGSGLEPPPHLVGERARALHVLAAGGLVCASAAAARRGPAAARRAARRRSGSPSATSRGWKGSRERWRSPATSASSGSTSAASSPCAAGSSTSSRRQVASRSAPSSSATRSSRCAPSRRSRSARCTRSTTRSSIRRPSGARPRGAGPGRR